MQETLPPGWAFVSLATKTDPYVIPLEGATGTLDFAWYPVPAFPIDFTYRVYVPAGQIGPKQLSGNVLFRVPDMGEYASDVVTTVIPLGGGFEGEGEGLPEGEGEGDGEGSPVEGEGEGRPVEGEGEGQQPTENHSADQNGDWDIGLSELLRVIQFYNSNGYHTCPEGEDGFCPGP